MLTGTDRVAYACKLLPYKIFINVQGDEPLVSPRDIEKLGKIKRESPEHIINGMCELSDGEDVQSKNIPKVVTNEAGLLLYMSRAAIPGTKEASLYLRFFARRPGQVFRFWEKKRS